jgi:hypothetical protein
MSQTLYCLHLLCFLASLTLASVTWEPKLGNSGVLLLSAYEHTWVP